MENQSPYLMHMDELAQVLDVHINTVYRLAKTDNLPVPVGRLGKRYVVARKDVEAIVGPIAYEPRESRSL